MGGKPKNQASLVKRRKLYRTHRLRSLGSRSPDKTMARDESLQIRQEGSGRGMDLVRRVMDYTYHRGHAITTENIPEQSGSIWNLGSAPSPSSRCEAEILTAMRGMLTPILGPVHQKAMSSNQRDRTGSPSWDRSYGLVVGSQTKCNLGTRTRLAAPANRG